MLQCTLDLRTSKKFWKSFVFRPAWKILKFADCDLKECILTCKRSLGLSHLLLNPRTNSSFSKTTYKLKIYLANPGCKTHHTPKKSSTIIFAQFAISHNHSTATNPQPYNWVC